MKNNFSKLICFLLMFFITGIVSVSAAEKELDDIDNRTYIIGTHEFTPGEALTSQRLMLAARTIKGDNVGLEDMIIYYKNSVGIWINAINSTLIPESNLPDKFNVQYTDDEFIGEEKIELKDVKKAGEGNIEEVYKENHNWNQSAITVSKEGNTITVTENKPMISYDNVYLDREWYGLIVDLNIPLEDLEAVSGYSIADIDRENGNLFGAGETEVLLWLQGGNTNSSRYIIFKNTKTDDIITITVKFEAVYDIKYESKGEVIITSSNNVSYDVDEKLFIVSGNVTKFTFTDDGIAKTVNNKVISTDLKFDFIKIPTEFAEEEGVLNQEDITVNQEGNTINVYKKTLKSQSGGAPVAGEWYALLVTLNTPVSELISEDYTIEEIDWEDVERFGGTIGQDFIIWLNAETVSKTITFKNTLNSDEELKLTINVYLIPTLLDAKKANNDSESLNEDYKINHEWNQESITVSREENTITVTETKPMVSYDNGYLPKKWYGLLVDLNIPLADLEAISGYNIDDIDKRDAHLFGATGNEILLWLQGDDDTRTITFKNTKTNETITITIEFEATDMVSTALQLNKAEVLDIDDTEDNIYNQEAITVTHETKTITVSQSKLLKKHENGAGTEGAWYGLLINLNTPVAELISEGYTIEKIDWEDVERFGGTIGQDFIIWLNAEVTSKTITFKNTLNPNDKLELTINVVKDYDLPELLDAKKAGEGNIEEAYKENHNWNQEAITVSREENTITVIETKTMVSYNNGSAYADKKWYGLLVDLNIPLADLEAISGYDIEDIDKTNAHLFGATGNEILLWLQGDNETRVITFKNTKTNETITITINVEIPEED